MIVTFIIILKVFSNAFFTHPHFPNQGGLQSSILYHRLWMVNLPIIQGTATSIFLTFCYRKRNQNHNDENDLHLLGIHCEKKPNLYKLYSLFFTCLDWVLISAPFYCHYHRLLLWWHWYNMKSSSLYQSAEWINQCSHRRAERSCIRSVVRQAGRFEILPEMEHWTLWSFPWLDFLSWPRHQGLSVAFDVVSILHV